MKTLKIKSQSNIKRHYKINGRYMLCKAILSEFALPTNARVKLTKLLIKMKKNSIVHLRLRCSISNRARSLVTPFKLSRIKFREKASFGSLMGVRKSSW